MTGTPVSLCPGLMRDALVLGLEKKCSVYECQHSTSKNKCVFFLFPCQTSAKKAIYSLIRARAYSKFI